MNASKDPKNMLKKGAIGTLITALCCFTPILVVLTGAVGLSAIVGYLDYVLFPALGGFIALTLYALWRLRRGSRPFCHCEKSEGESS